MSTTQYACVDDPSPALPGDCVAWIAVEPPFWTMSDTDQALVGFAIVGVWAAAWGFRMLANFLLSNR